MNFRRGEIENLLFSKNWDTKKLGDIITEIFTGHLPKVIDQKEGNFPTIKLGDISKLKISFIYECKTFLDVSDIKSKRIANKGDILVIYESGTKNLVGKTFLYLGEKSCMVGGSIHVIKHKQNPKYLFHALNSFNSQKQIQIASGKNHMHGLLNRIRIEDLKKITIPLPDIQTQAKIADYLDRLLLSKYELDNSLKEMLEIRQKQYEYYKELLLNGGIDRWDILPLSEIATDIYLGNGVTKSQLGTGDYPAIKCGDVNSSLFLNFDTCTSFVNSDLIKNPRFFNHGDILMGALAHNIRSIGKVSLYLGKEKCIVGNDVIVIRSNQNQKYLTYFLSSKFCRKQLEKLSLPGAVVHLYMKNVNKIKIPLPPLKEQEEIVSKLDKYTEDFYYLKSNICLISRIRQQQYSYFSNLLFSKK